ncbi:U3 small nucleolar RNA-associated protein 15-like protein [Trichoplax sp. H2]|nr:U3 small nucleolar RNA-associated protein 15-like protein [Trichoplax sp. H2]|eukprot:RDD45049.1 U3 small nucleolar RNA-associated protein 15-like protein [Trichoplax sp. H2]
MADFKRIPIKKFSKANVEESSESSYWMGYKFPIVAKEHSAISCIDFSPVLPHHYAVTCSAKVQLYDCASNQVYKAISRFHDSALCGTFRYDGKLITAGSGDGLVQVFDTHSRTVLRQLHGHKRAAHVARFAMNNLHIISASDDKLVRCWDLPTGKEVVIFDEHTDYIRAGDVSRVSSDVWVTGSYDHTLKLWDRRTDKSSMTIDHGAPVEAVLIYPSGSICISAGSNYIKVWDLIGGGRLLMGVTNHQKTITCLCLDNSGQRLLSGSLDRHVKIYDIKDYKVVHSMDYSSPITSLGISPDDSHLVVGMSDGLLSIKERPRHKQELPKFKWRPKGRTVRYFNSRKSGPSKDAVIVAEKKLTRLPLHDKLLRQFKYTEALDSVLKKSSNHPPVIVSVIQELIRRDGLPIALSGRDEDALLPVLYFIKKNISNPRYSSLVSDVANIVFDIYSPILGQSSKVDNLFLQIKDKIHEETRLHESFGKLLGVIDMMLTANNTSANSISAAPLT